MPTRSEFSPALARADGRIGAAKAAWDLICDLAGDRGFVAICTFSVIGLLVSLCLVMLFPFMSEMASLLAKF